MLKHLKVPESEAQATKVFLEDCKALNEGFLPIKKSGYVLWPLNFEVEGEIIECIGLPSKRVSRDYRLKLPPKIMFTHKFIAYRIVSPKNDTKITKIRYVSIFTMPSKLLCHAIVIVRTRHYQFIIYLKEID